MSNVERLTLPESQAPCNQCGLTTQYADLVRRPSHAQMRDHEKFSRKAISEDSSLGVEDGMIHVFVVEWHVLDVDGNEVPKKLDQMGRVPQDTLSLVVEEIAAITASTRPNDAIGQVIAVMRAMKSRVDDDEGAKIEQAMSLFREALGVPVPNAPDQTES